MTEDQIITQALSILKSRARQYGVQVRDDTTAADYLTAQLSEREHEVFAAMFLNARNQLIEYRELFYGTIDRAAVYPREMVKAALELNAAAVVISHNHPSGSIEPSDADITLTQQLQQILAIVDVRLLDHILIAGGRSASFARQGLI